MEKTTKPPTPHAIAIQRKPVSSNIKRPGADARLIEGHGAGTQIEDAKEEHGEFGEDAGNPGEVEDRNGRFQLRGIDVADFGNKDADVARTVEEEHEEGEEEGEQGEQPCAVRDRGGDGERQPEDGERHGQEIHGRPGGVGAHFRTADDLPLLLRLAECRFRSG